MYEIFEELLKEKGLSVAEISRRTGIAKSTLSDWKNGKFELKIDKKRKIADVLGVSVDYLDGLTPFRDGIFDFDAEVELMEEFKASKKPLTDAQKRFIEQHEMRNALLKDNPYKGFDASKFSRNTSYYSDIRTAELADQLSRREDLRMLFDTVKDIPADDMKLVMRLVEALKNE